MEEELDLRQYWEILRKRWLIVVAVPLIAALSSGLISFLILKPVYQASTTLIVGKKLQNLAKLQYKCSIIVYFKQTYNLLKPMEQSLRVVLSDKMFLTS